MQTDERVNLEEIMRGIKEKVRQKKESGLYTDSDIEEISSVNVTDPALLDDKAGLILAQMRLLKDFHDFKKDFSPRSHRPMIGKIIVPAKKFMFKIFSFALKPIWERQVTYNYHLIHVLESLAEELNSLKRENAILKLQHENETRLLSEALEKLKARPSVVVPSSGLKQVG